MLDKTRQVNRDDFKPLYAQLADILIDYIKDNNLKVGDILPSEHQLIEHFGISQMTIRQALQRLATEGYIIRLQGKGTFVAQPRIREKLEGVQSLEERFAKQGITVTTALIETDMSNPTPLYIDELQLPQDSKTFRVRRLKMVDGDVLGLETRLFPPAMKTFFSPIELGTKSFVDIFRKDPETEIHKICFRTRSALVLEMEAEMMGVPADTPVLIQHGVYYTASDKPIMAGRMVYLADKVEILYEIRDQHEHELNLYSMKE